MVPLQAHNNDVNRAVNAFFEDPDALRKQVRSSLDDAEDRYTDVEIYI